MVACQTADPDDEGWSLTFMADVESPYVFAAAPDLLAALVDIQMRAVLGGREMNDIEGIARAAIAKAKGIES